MLDVVIDLAWGQFGAVSTTQAEERGVARSSLSRGADRGVLERRAPGVYVLTAAPPSARQTLMVHLLAAGAGALAGADSGLGLWCPELVLPRRPVLLVPRSCGYRSRGAELRRSRDLHLANPGRVAGVARCLLDASIGRTVDEVQARIDACRRHGSLAIGALVSGSGDGSEAGAPAS